MKAAVLKHPAVILAAAVAGSAIGLYNSQISNFLHIESFAKIIAVPGQIYLFYLQMTVIPIIITAIASSFGKLVRNKSGDGFVKRLILVFLAGIGITAVIGILFGSLGRPGAGLDQNTRSLLTSLISSEPQSDVLEVSLSATALPETLQRNNLTNFFTSMVPSNIFSALSLGSTMAVVFFSITFGIAIGLLNDDSATLLINMLSAIFEAFQKLVNSSLYLLPFGLICLMAEQIAAVGIQIFMAMSKFIFLYCIGTGFLFIVSTIIIWRRSGQKNFLKVLSTMFEPVVLALATRNSMATLPSAIKSLHHGLGFNKNQVNLTLPLGMTLGRFGNIFYFGIAVFFVAQLYGAQLSPTSYIIIFLGTILAGTATAGASGIVTISVISIALGPLNLPVEAVLVIFMAIDPIIDPFRTLLLVYANIATTAVIVDRDTSPQAEESDDTQVIDVADAVCYSIPDAPAGVHDTPLNIPDVLDVTEVIEAHADAVIPAATATYSSSIPPPFQKKIAADTIDAGQGKTGRRKKLKSFGNIRVIHGIIFINAFFLIVAAAIILSVMWFSSKKNAQELSESLISEIQNSVQNKTLDYFIPVEKVNKTLAFMTPQYFADPINDEADKQRAFEIYDDLMRKYTQMKMIYYADAFGNLIMLNKMEDGTFSQRTVSNDGSKISILWEHANFAYYGTHPNTTDPALSGYDPRNRIWFTSAAAAKNMIWTPVYIFATDHLPGFTCSIPMYNKRGTLEGVNSIDISVSELSTFLGTMQPTPGTRIVILDRNENLVALQAKSAGDLKNLFEIIPDGKNTTYSIRNIDSYPDETGRTILRDTLKLGDGIHTIKFNNERFKSVISPVNIGSGLDLSIGIFIPENDIVGNINRSLYQTTFFSIGVLLLIIIFSSLLAKAIASPMQVLSDEMSKVRSFQLDSDTNVNTRFLEIINMRESFEGMKQGLKNFKRYVPSDLVEKLMNEEITAEIGGEKRELTMLFSDIAHFTSISEREDPEELIKDLCTYFESVSKVIIENKGTIDKYIGDSVMAFWGAPVKNENHAESACRSAVQIQQMLRTMFRQWKNMEKYPFFTRIGIHTGDVIVGNMGYTERLNYTVIGDHVNVASRLEGINKIYGTKILVSESTYDRCHNMFEFRMLDKIAVVGRSESLTIYELYSEKNDIEKTIRKLFNYYEDGVAYYFERKWDEAIKCFRAVLKYRPHDTPSIVMYRRCVNYKKKSPPNDWNGVYVSTIK
ncbi:MAG: cation:dicarboxylase symporter family transporter [Spirochaetaceae bacterium]|jgi:adenylate cyclase|nr:cation:dicarboxylase symporter family transporter [Spirochaetaceae bacterium]